MIYDFADKTIGQLENIVANHRRVGKTDTEYLVEALRALDARRHKGFDFQQNLKALVRAEQQRAFEHFSGAHAA